MKRKIKSNSLQLPSFESFLENGFRIEYPFYDIKLILNAEKYNYASGPRIRLLIYAIENKSFIANLYEKDFPLTYKGYSKLILYIQNYNEFKKQEEMKDEQV